VTLDKSQLLVASPVTLTTSVSTPGRSSAVNGQRPSEEDDRVVNGELLKWTEARS
jgi:hypothetical protein